MDLVLCMAGLYRRFRDAGYPSPKFLLPWHGRTVLAEILAGMLDGGAFSRVLLVANRRDIAHRQTLVSILAQHGLGGGDLLFIGDTAGQADTALIGVRHLSAGDRPVLFHNIDTLLVGRDYRAVAAQLAAHDGYIDTFAADSPAYSYVSVDQGGLVTAIAEKVVISRHATTGAYGFASQAEFARHAAGCAVTAGERYISAVYARMIAGGARIRAGIQRPGEETIILGTPAEYEQALVAS